ncbi:rod shape-determining protein MreC [Ruminococcaceae bacterium YRB3002]|nr:rod shape-determining protein MreC [Ruminococcaceae bacterium YRB3002]
MVAVVIIAAIILLGALPGSPVNFRKISSGLGNVIKPVQNLVRKAYDSFDDYNSAIFDGIAIRHENEALRAEIADLQYRLRQNEEAAIRYEELKDAFHIKDTFSNYEVYGASILSNEADEWFSSVRVSVGTDQELQPVDGLSYVVVDVHMNLVGRVIEVSEGESTILPILHEGFAVSCKVNEVNSSTFVLTGNTALKNDGLCRISGINPNNIPDVGSEIVTSGEGGLFPEGIPIGVITSVDSTNPLQITAVLKPYADLGSIHDLFILVPPAADAEPVTEAGAEDADNEAQ